METWVDLQRQEYDGPYPLFDEIEKRIDDTPALNEHRNTILCNFPFWNDERAEEYNKWMLSATVEQIISWAERN